MSDVSRTAVGVAALRALESARPDRLFNDPYARAFLPETMPQNPAGVSVFRLYVVVRTKFYDDYLTAAVASGCRQVVLLAAGLDTRAFRLTWPQDVRLYELDLPALLSYKEKILGEQGAKPAVARTLVAVDLREDWAARLRAAGFDPTAPTAWLIEGLLVYLEPQDAIGVLASVTDLSASGSQVACEHRDDKGQHSPGRAARATAELSEVTTMWKEGIPTYDWLADHGWDVESHDGNELAVDYGREVDAPVGNFLIGKRP